jgi:hypothetical protein
MLAAVAVTVSSAMSKRRAAWAGVAVVAGLLVCLAVGYLAYLGHEDPRAGYDRIELGMGEVDVMALMGRPADVRRPGPPRPDLPVQPAYGLVWFNQGGSRGAVIEVEFGPDGAVVAKHAHDTVGQPFARRLANLLGL